MSQRDDDESQGKLFKIFHISKLIVLVARHAHYPKEWGKKIECRRKTNMGKIKRQKQCVGKKSVCVWGGGEWKRKDRKREKGYIKHFKSTQSWVSLFCYTSLLSFMPNKLALIKSNNFFSTCLVKYLNCSSVWDAISSLLHNCQTRSIVRFSKTNSRPYRASLWWKRFSSLMSRLHYQ